MIFIRKYKRKGRVYLAEVKNHWSDGKCKQEFIRYIGVAPDSDRKVFPSCNEDLSLDGIKLHGSVLVLHSIAKQLGLHQILGDNFAPILALAICHCHDYKSIKNMKQWFKSTNFFRILNIEEITEKQLHNAISSIDDMNLLEIEKSVFEKMSAKFNDSGEGLVYDVTNTYLRGTASIMAKKGKDKEGVKGRNLIQIGLALTFEKKLPIFHQTHPGNINDSKIFEEGIEILNRFEVKRGIIIYDRGMHASNSIFRLANTKWKLLGGVPLSAGIKKIISNTDFEKMKNCRYRYQYGDSSFHVKTLPHQIGNIKGKLLIMINLTKKFKLGEKRLKEIMNIKKSGKEIPENYKRFFKKNGDINSHAINQTAIYDGASVLFTTGKISIYNIIKTYFDKDLIEQSFKTLKSVLKLRPIRCWLDGKIKGHIFICYLSLVLLTTLRLLVDEKGKKSIKGLSIGKIMEELKSIYVIEYSNKKNPGTPKNSYQKVITLSNLQKDIFGALMPNLKF